MNTYKSSVSIFLAFVLSFVSAFAFDALAGEPVPPDTGMVTFTFDDANSSMSEFVKPLLDEYDQNAVLYTPTGLIDTPGYMTWDEVQAFYESGWEIGAHGVNHLELPTLSSSAMEQEIAQSYQDLVARGITATSFATPFGAYDNETLNIIAKYFNAHRTFHSQGLNRWPYNKYLLYVRQITNQTSVAEVSSWVDEATTNGYWLILVFHEVFPEVDDEDTTSWRVDQLEELLEYLEHEDVPVKTMEEALMVGLNLLPNASFDEGLSGGWSTDNSRYVRADSNNNGSYPSPRHSIRLIGTRRTASHLFSPRVGVSSDTLYAMRSYTDTRGLRRGEVGYYIDEYNEAGAWISGKWIVGITQPNVIDEAFRYQPSSPAVKSASVQVYLTKGSHGSVYVDNIELSTP